MDRINHVQVQMYKLKIPDGALKDVYSAYEAMDYKSSPTLWLGQETVDHLMRIIPIKVVRIDRHYEVFGGLRTFMMMSALCDHEETIEVELYKANPNELVSFALFEFVSIHMFYGVGGKDVALQLYPILKDLRAKHPKEFHESLPRVRTLKDIKGLLKLTNVQVKRPQPKFSALQEFVQRQVN